MQKNKLVRITTVPISLEKLLEDQLRFMKSHYEVTAISADQSNLERVGQLQEVPVFHVEMTRKITPLQDLKSVWKLYKYFRREKPFIVHTHTPKAGTAGMIAAKLAGVPHRLHTIAGLPLLEATGNKKKLLNFVEKITYACATKVYPNSFGLRDIIIDEQFCKSEKLKVIGNGSSNGINTSYFNPVLFSSDEKQSIKTNLGVLADDFVFIFVGRLVGDKGINELIAAFRKLSSRTAKAKLLLVGFFETELDPLEQEIMEEINSNIAIISVGFQKDVRPYLAISHCFAFPSYREGFPNVVMQAGAMGLPCIVTNINGCNEIIEEGKNGTIIPVKDCDTLYKEMRKMIDDNDFRTRLQQNARAMIVSRYEQQLVWDAVLAEYKSLEKNV
ncbi:MAG: glycosyltransferase involved in cell wall biosynthesis [Flavobacterium sp.]|jgi:glycosyltransferase involved in cell wall biosynthesis